MKKTMTPREGKKIRANSKKIKTEQKSKTNKNETKKRYKCHAFHCLKSKS